MFHKSLRLLTLLCICATSSVAPAKDTSSVTQYPVAGKTAAEIYEDIKKHAPRVASNATFAFTMIATKTDKREKAKANSCRYDKMKTSAIFNFVLPNHTAPDAMSPKTRAKWVNFVAYLAAHEAGHRTIWRNCLDAYDKGALALQAPGCKTLNEAREQLFTQLKRGCLAQDEAYDVQFRKDVLKNPFVAEALKTPKSSN